MIIRCGHLREIDVLKHQCCFHCHGPAGCVVETLPEGHKAIYCCARTDPLTADEIETILANIPKWEAWLDNPRYHARLRQAYKSVQTKLRLIADLMLDAHIEPE
jgi:hypothetical protein